jgi:hypothetical protein
MSEKDNIKIELAPELQSIQSMFETGKVKRMYDLMKLYPTLIIKGLRMNHGSYAAKLSRPEKFTTKEIIKFSRLIQVHYDKINAVIFKEALENVIADENKVVNKPKKKSTGRPKKPKNK